MKGRFKLDGGRYPPNVFLYRVEGDVHNRASYIYSWCRTATGDSGDTAKKNICILIQSGINEPEHIWLTPDSILQLISHLQAEIIRTIEDPDLIIEAGDD